MQHLDHVSAYRLRVPLVTPYRLAFGAVEHYDTIVVEAVDSDGQGGFGEATVLTGYTDETIEDSWRIAREFAADLAGIDCDNAASRIEQLGLKFPFTATAFGTALEMLAGSETLKVGAGISVPLVGLLHAEDEGATAAEFERLFSEGYRTIKVKVGFDVGADLRRVQGVQRVAAGRARIRIDANQGYTADEGRAFATALDPAGIELFEQPCAAGDWDAHLAVARASPVPMMLDESIYGLADIEKAAALRAASYIKVKLMKLVTLERLIQAIERIASLGMRAVLGNGVACDLGCWMEACVAARHIDNAGEMNGFLKARSGLFTDELAVAAGAIAFSSDFSPQLDPQALERYRVDSVICTARPARVGAASSGTARE